MSLRRPSAAKWRRAAAFIALLSTTIFAFLSPTAALAQTLPTAPNVASQMTVGWNLGNTRVEAEVLSGLPISTLDDMRAAARRIRALGARVVVVKGGHLPQGDRVIDVVCTPGAEFDLTGPRFETRHTHGTGCTFSSAIAAYLALGQPVDEALRSARLYLEGAIQHAPGLGGGHGPLNHFWRLY